MTRLCAALAFVLLASSSLAAPAPAPTLVGNWYGIGEPDDPDIFYIDSYASDGTFHSEYRKCEKGKLVYQQTQSGKWNYRGGVLTMNANMINGKPGVFDHSYTIEELTPTEFKARMHGPTPFLFVENRIPKFEFPPCYLGA
jgi:hypothetical protein